MPPPRRDRALLVVMGGAATILVGCGAKTTNDVFDVYVTPEGPVGNTTPPYDAIPRDTNADTTHVAWDGPVGNTAAPFDTALPDVVEEPDASFGDGPVEAATDSSGDE